MLGLGVAVGVLVGGVVGVIVVVGVVGVVLVSMATKGAVLVGGMLLLCYDYVMIML